MAGNEDTTAHFITQIWDLVEPVIQAEGMALVEVEYRRESQGWVLRLFIDSQDGVTVADCARVSQLVGDFLDVADLISNPYHLEVSSPGLDRPLRKWEHFKEVQGKVVEVRTKTSIQNRRKFKGVLVDVNPEEITVDCAGSVFTIAMALVERARLRYFDSLEG